MVNWSNIADCAQQRADFLTFNWDDSNSPLGDLETREMARMMGYRQALLEAVACESC